MARKNPKFDFEASITALEALVEKMESGAFSLEESLQQFENGMALAKACQKALKEAEQKVMQLTSNGDGEEALEAFDPDGNE